VKCISRFLAAYSFLLVLLAMPVKATSQGYLEGHLKIVFGTAVESDDMAQPQVLPETYGRYPLVILSRQGKKEVARLTADANGNYRATLPPGDYILDVGERVAKHIQANPQPFTVVANQTVRVDLRAFIGFYKGQAWNSLDDQYHVTLLVHIPAVAVEHL
jgi:hypothetical protein